MNLKLIVCAALAAVSTVACGSGGPTEVAGSIDDLAGVEWVLTHFNEGEPLPAGQEITLVLAEGNFAGSSGCNRYSSGVTVGEAPGELSLGPALGTRMACPEEVMELEMRYLGMLAGVGSHAVRDGVLSLAWTLEDETGTMTFNSRPLAE